MICSSENLDRFIACLLFRMQANLKARTFQGSRSPAMTSLWLNIVFQSSMNNENTRPVNDRYGKHRYESNSSRLAGLRQCVWQDNIPTSGATRTIGHGDAGQRPQFCQGIQRMRKSQRNAASNHRLVEIPSQA